MLQGVNLDDTATELQNLYGYDKSQVRSKMTFDTTIKITSVKDGKYNLKIRRWSYNKRSFRR